jgi:hypothetical protein
MPRRVSSAQASSAESCWLHDVRTLATRDLSNETSRERFTCVVAYSFVWRDSRTSVALCTPRLPNCMSTSLQCRLLCGVGHSASVFPVRRPPHQTVRADFPHTASRVKLVCRVETHASALPPVRLPPRQTVRAGFPHTAFHRVLFLLSWTLPFFDCLAYYTHFFSCQPRVLLTSAHARR